MTQKWAILIAWACAGACSLSSAQAPEQPSLTEQLRAEGATSLARAAREHGSAIRGLILFPQKSLNCANCHAPGAHDLGPNLMQIAKDVPDEHFVESILWPSKVITKGFESVKVLTADGEVVIGRVDSDNDGALVLRDPTDAKKLVRIDRDDIEEILPNEKSTMPDGLADQLKDRQQLLDLVKYLMDIAATAKPTEPPGEPSASGEVDARLRGLALIDHFGCENCHRADAQSFPRKRAPILGKVTSRIDPAYLRRFIADPHTVKPRTSMPNMLGELADQKREAAVDAITQYLMSLNEPASSSVPVQDGSSARGDELFHTVGCVACHSPRDSGRENLTDDSLPLGMLDDKYTHSGLAAFLEDPHAVRPSGRMPNMKLQHGEAIDIASYLLSAEQTESMPLTKDESLIGDGKRFFEKLGCASCHDSQQQTPPSMSIALASTLR